MAVTVENRNNKIYIRNHRGQENVYDPKEESWVTQFIINERLMLFLPTRIMLLISDRSAESKLDQALLTAIKTVESNQNMALSNDNIDVHTINQIVIRFCLQLAESEGFSFDITHRSFSFSQKDNHKKRG